MPVTLRELLSIALALLLLSLGLALVTLYVTLLFSRSCARPCSKQTRDKYTEEDLQITTKITLNFFLQRLEHGQAQATMAQALAYFKPCEQSFKARFLDL